MIEIKVDGNTYTEKEFQRDLKRYLDTLNEDLSPCKFKQDCEKCMFSKYELCAKYYVNSRPIKYSFEIIEKVYRWAKAHPCVTNRDKIKEVFGINVINSIVVDCGKKESCYAYRFSNIKDKSIVLNPISQYDEAFGDWLDEEYKESKKND